MIETWYNYDYQSKKEISELLYKDKGESTIRRKINRGKIMVHEYEWNEEGY